MVPLIRALALLFVSCSLFVQVAANAAAVPQLRVSEMECAQMAQSMQQHQTIGLDEPSDNQGCCPDMSLDCLVAMNCLSPLAITAINAYQPAASQIPASYLPAVSRMLEGKPPPPESPPPQSSFMV